jgi:replicative DNA helicase
MSNLPSTPDAEKAVLSCALQWGDCLDKVATHPSGSDLFYTPAHREIWGAMMGLQRTGQHIDLVTLSGALRESGRLDAVGGAAMLSELLSDVPSPKMLPAYLKAAQEATKRRRMALECHSLAADACDTSNDIDEVIQRGDTAIQKLMRSATVARSRSWSEVMGTTICQIEEARRAGGKIPGISTGFPELDEATNGYQAGQLWVLAARPGQGKSALLMNLAENLVKVGNAAAIFSAEMLAEQLAVRSLSGQARIDSLKLARGEINKPEFARMQTAIEKSIGWPLWIDDRAGMRLIDIQVATRQMVKEFGVKVIFVDYLQLIKEPEGSRNREDAVRRLSDGFTQLAKELGITVIALAQLNRSSEKRDGKKPQVSDLRDSGAIEQDANVILLLHPLEPDSTEMIVDVEVIVGKCRGGRLGPIAFEFDKPTTTFYPKKKNDN